MAGVRSLSSTAKTEDQKINAWFGYNINNMKKQYIAVLYTDKNKKPEFHNICGVKWIIINVKNPKNVYKLSGLALSGVLVMDGLVSTFSKEYAFALIRYST